VEEFRIKYLQEKKEEISNLREILTKEDKKFQEIYLTTETDFKYEEVYHLIFMSLDNLDVDRILLL
jgi:hypothetical protein